MKKRNTLIPVILLIIVLMMLGFLSYIFFYNLNSVSEEEFVNQLTQMGEDFYTEYYYKSYSNDMKSEDLKDYLKKFEDIGLQVNLVELEKYSDENKSQIERFLRSNKNCKKEGTMIIIYPKSPYSKNDYKSEIRLDCEKIK